MNKKIKICIFLLLIFSMILGIMLIKYEHSPIKPSGESLESPSKTHYLGTDDLGIDIFAQVSKGFFTSMKIGLLCSIISIILGGSLGYIAGYFGGRIDTSIMFIVDIFLSIPRLPVFILLGSLLNQSTWNIIILISLFSWASIARLIRNTTIVEMNKNYIRISKLYGAKPTYILFEHLYSEIIPILLISGIHIVGRSIIDESSMAFLGLSDPTTKSLGMMINNAMRFNGIYFTDFWKWWLVPPIIILLFLTYIFRIISRELEYIRERG